MKGDDIITDALKVMLVLGGTIALIWACVDAGKDYAKIPDPPPRTCGWPDKYEEGKQAQRAGVPVEANPYYGGHAIDQLSIQGAWQNGWVDAKLEADAKTKIK